MGDRDDKDHAAKGKRPIPIGCLLCQSPNSHQNSEHGRGTKQHWSPNDPSSERAFNTPLLTLLSWEQNKDSDNESFLSILLDPLAMGNAGHYIGTEPRRAVDILVIFWVLLYRSTVCPCVQGRVEV